MLHPGANALKRSLGAVFLFLLLPGFSSALSTPVQEDNAKALLNAIKKVDEAAATDAIRKLIRDVNEATVNTLADALHTCTLTGKRLEDKKEDLWKKVEKIRPKSTSKVGKPLRFELDQAHVHYYDHLQTIDDLGIIRTEIIRSFKQIDSDRAVEILSNRLKSKKEEASTRAEIAEILGSIRTSEALQALLTLLSKKEETSVKIAALDGLRNHRDRSEKVISAAVSALHDSQWQVVLAAALLLKSLQAREAIPDLIQVFKRPEDTYLKERINTLLVEFTGDNRHEDFDAWMYSWEKNKESILRKGFRPSPPTGGDPQKGTHQTTFYGIPLKTDSVIFVVDFSRSMSKPSQWTPPEPTRGVKTGDQQKKSDLMKGLLLSKNPAKVDVAKYELKKVLSELPDGTEFNIIFFNHYVHTLFNKMVTLNRKTRTFAFEEIDKAGLILGTDLNEAMKLAFRFAGFGGYTQTTSKVDTLFLVSDGEPWLRMEVKEKGVVDKAEIEKNIKEWNRFGIRINTIAITPAGGKGFLRRVAETHGGTYVER